MRRRRLKFGRKRQPIPRFLHEYEERIILRQVLLLNRSFTASDLMFDAPGRYRRTYLIRALRRMAHDGLIGSTFTMRRSSRSRHRETAYHPQHTANRAA